MNSPILRLVSYSRSLSLQEYRGIWFGAYEEGKRAKESTQEERDPSGPSPTQVTLRDEASDNRTCNRPDECRTSKQPKREAPLHRAPKVGQSTSHNGQRCRAKHASEKATQHYCFHILRDRHRDLEDSEHGKTSKKRNPAAITLRYWSPTYGTYSEALQIWCKRMHSMCKNLWVTDQDE